MQSRPQELSRLAKKNIPPKSPQPVSWCPKHSRGELPPWPFLPMPRSPSLSGPCSLQGFVLSPSENLLCSGPGCLLRRWRRPGFSEGSHSLQPQNPWIFELLRSSSFCWLTIHRAGAYSGNCGLSPLRPFHGFQCSTPKCFLSETIRQPL